MRLVDLGLDFILFVRLLSFCNVLALELVYSVRWFWRGMEFCE